MTVEINGKRYVERWEYYDLDTTKRKLEEENRKLKAELEQFNKWVKAWTIIIGRQGEEIRNLKEEIFFRNNRISWFEWEEERLNSVINTLKKKLESSVWFWKKKVAKLSEENRQLKHRNEILDLSLKTSVNPLVYNELVWSIEISKSNEWRNS